MKYLRWLSIGTALALCLCIAAPFAAQAASTTAQAKHRKTTQTQAKAAKKTASASVKNKRHAKGVKGAATRHKTVANKTTAKKGGADRDLWLKRAQQGDLLSGKASFYGTDFHNKATASGLSYDAAQQINLGKRGVGRVNLEVVSDETGTPLKADHAYFVRYGAHGGASKVGPFRAFADAAAMHEALRQAHPEAEVVLDSTR